MSFDMNPADEDPHGECRHEIQLLRKQIQSLQMDLDIANEFRRDAMESLQEFQKFDGDEDLWAAMKRDRDKAMEVIKSFHKCSIAGGRAWDEAGLYEVLQDARRVLRIHGITTN